MSILSKNKQNWINLGIAGEFNESKCVKTHQIKNSDKIHIVFQQKQGVANISKGIFDCLLNHGSEIIETCLSHGIQAQILDKL